MTYFLCLSCTTNCRNNKLPFYGETSWSLRYFPNYIVIVYSYTLTICFRTHKMFNLFKWNIILLKSYNQTTQGPLTSVCNCTASIIQSKSVCSLYQQMLSWVTGRTCRPAYTEHFEDVSLFLLNSCVQLVFVLHFFITCFSRRVCYPKIPF